MLANPAFSVTDERQCGASTGTDVVRGPYLRSGAGACAACSSFLDIKGPTIAGRAPLSSTIAGRAPSPPPPTCESEKPGKRPVAGNECHASQCHTRRRKQGGERIRWEGGSDPPPLPDVIVGATGAAIVPLHAPFSVTDSFPGAS
jgi:hypothetical protein